MNKKAILNYVLVKYENEDGINKEILQDIKDTIAEIEVARAMFNAVSDPMLIEAAIYREEAAKKKFDYLFTMAKEQYNKKKLEA